jgi:choline-sulfatase
MPAVSISPAGPPGNNRRPPNLLVIVSDEHDGALLGAAGHPHVQTPNLDRLAATGTLFQRAYCAGPVCVPSRLSLLTGRYPHQVGAWDNGSALDSDIPTWGHHLGRAGYETVICGRTHFNGPDRLHGFDRRYLEDLPFWHSPVASFGNRSPQTRRTRQHVSFTSASEDVADPLTRRHDTYDAEVAEHAIRFLQDNASHLSGASASSSSGAGSASGSAPGEASSADRPWLLYCGLIHPHFPLVAPREVLQRYDPADVILPPTWDEDPATQHPVIRQLRHALGNDVPLTEDAVRRAIAAYWSLVTLVDQRIGTILGALDTSPFRDNTVVLYTSDHGDMAGHHGMWQKHCFYEPSVRVPLILRLPDSFQSVQTPALPPLVEENVSLVDVLPTLLDLAGAPIPEELPGHTLLDPQPNRPVFSEMHEGMLDAGFMLKRGPYKYVCYAGGPPQLFHTHQDPLEQRDLAQNPTYTALLADLHAALLKIVDPAATDAAAKADQTSRRRS